MKSTNARLHRTHPTLSHMPMKRSASLVSSALGLLLLAGTAACADSSDTATTDGSEQDLTATASALGSGDHTAKSVTLEVVASSKEGLANPTALGFNPTRPDELWVTNYDDNTAVIVSKASTARPAAEKRDDGYSLHFMASPTSISFGQDATTFGKKGTFATCQDSRNTYNDTQPHNDFMGPSLWSSDPTVFAKQNPYGLGSHIDMLHVTPQCMGIVHAQANWYWTFGGLNGSLDLYDFGRDHGIGADDHSDGKAYQFVAGQVRRVAGVQSGLAYDAATDTLYVADTGNGRIARLDQTGARLAARLQMLEPMVAAYRVDGAKLVDIVAKGTGPVQPSGLVLVGKTLFVSDHATGKIYAYSTDGKLLNYLDTGLGKDAVGGLAVGPDGKVYFSDQKGNRVVRITVPSTTNPGQTTPTKPPTP